MIGLLQRVSQAAVTVDGVQLAIIDAGVLVLVGVEKGDTTMEAARLAERICGYRVFPDADGRMNLSVSDHGGGVLLVPQFTLAANTHKGLRASFTTAADPATGRLLYSELIDQVSARHEPVQSGSFGAHMAVSLINDGPVTFWLRVPPPV